MGLVYACIRNDGLPGVFICSYVLVDMAGFIFMAVFYSKEMFYYQSSFSYKFELFGNLLAVFALPLREKFGS